MLIYLSTLFYILFFLRFITVSISARNEKKLKRSGALEFGKRNSVFLVGLHFAFYGACIIEGYTHNAFYTDKLAIYGLVVYAAAIAVLYYVIYAIKHVWTVKLIVAPQNYHVTGSQFRNAKFINYFLNIIPELVGLSLIFHAWLTLTIVLPVYLIPLVIRVWQGEKIIKDHF